MRKFLEFMDSIAMADLGVCVFMALLLVSVAAAKRSPGAYLYLGDTRFLDVIAPVYLMSAFLAEFRRWLNIRAKTQSRIIPKPPLEGFAHGAVLACWSLIFGLLWSARRRNPLLEAPPELYALAAKTLAITGGAWLSTRLRARWVCPN
jgi:hypothetical protein